ncbi:MAG TPA: hypothetical protein VLQ47_06790, partial [Rhodoferax sp.]|nr:hypothetical protein [Rhodoferax sp.]
TGWTFLAPHTFEHVPLSGCGSYHQSQISHHLAILTQQRQAEEQDQQTRHKNESHLLEQGKT